MTRISQNSRAIPLFAALIAASFSNNACAQEIVKCGEGGSYASYAPWRVARSTRHWGDQSRIMQTRPVYVTPEIAAAIAKGEPIPTNDWWTDALVSRWTGNLWSYPAKVRINQSGVRVAFPSYWIDNGTEMKERSALVVSAAGDFNPEATLVSGWHDWDVEMVLRDASGAEIKTTLVHGSPFTWIESKGAALKISIDNDENLAVSQKATGGGELVKVGGDSYGVWRGKSEEGEWIAIGLLPDENAFAALAPYAASVIRSTRVAWKYDEATSMLTTTWLVKTEDLRGKTENPVALQGFQPHHLKPLKGQGGPKFKCVDALKWQTPRGVQRVAAGNALSIDYFFPGMLPYWGAPAAAKATAKDAKGRYDETLFRGLLADYAARGSFGGDTYWGGKGLLQMAFAMMAARETGDEKTYSAAHAKLRAKFEDWLTWEPGEERFFFSYVPKWGGLVGEGTSYDSDAFNDHHFHYGYFTYAGALLCLVDEDFKEKFGPMLTMIAKDYANWDRSEKRFPFFRTFDPWAGHSFAGGVGDGGGNGQESTSEAMQGWGGLYMLGLALGDDAMRDAGIFGYVSEARGVAEYWFDRDRENIDYTKYKHPYNSNLTCHGVGWWTYFSGDPVWMHSIQWLPNTPALDYLSEDLKFAKWDWTEMWTKKEIGGWFEKGKTRDGHETNAVGNESLGNVLLSYLQRHDPQQAAEIFEKLREKKLGAAVNADTGHMTYWAIHSHLTYGEIDFGVKADYPCARAFDKGGRKFYMVYNCSSAPRKVKFSDMKGSVLAEVDAAPGKLTVCEGTGKTLKSRELAAFAAKDAPAEPMIPKGVSMPDLAQGKTATATSQESGGLAAENITDGDDKTRWSSSHSDKEPTATIDLGETVELYGSEIKWENSFAARYVVEVSQDGAKWTLLGGERAGFEGLQKLSFGGEKARYIRMRALAKATQYGVSMFSWRVFGKSHSQRAGAPLGLAVEADRAVLKEGAPSKIAAKAWMGKNVFKDVDAKWTSDDGAFTAGGFVPSTNGFATVRAEALGLSVSAKLPVEEALAASTLVFTPSNIVAIAGEPVKVGIEARDQFGGKMSLKDAKMELVDKAGKRLPQKAYKTQKGGLFTFAQAGTYYIKVKMGGCAAQCEIAVSSLKDVNLARLSTITASGEENGSLGAKNAADGSEKTRWSSRHRDGEWIAFDFGRERTVSQCAIEWENARASEYVIEVSLDGEKWQTVADVKTNPGGLQKHEFKPVKARKLRITGFKRNTGYGISIFETEIR